MMIIQKLEGGVVVSILSQGEPSDRCHPSHLSAFHHPRAHFASDSTPQPPIASSIRKPPPLAQANTQQNIYHVLAEPETNKRKVVTTLLDLSRGTYRSY
ncbi:hypothetical protein V2G26_009902 [Clonostachys chloroleuca]